MRLGKLQMRAQTGYTFVMLLALVAMVALALSIAGPTWAEANRRARERELLRVGALYARAILEFHDDSPGSLKSFPRSLDDLARDNRFAGVHRHLRDLYPDPLDPGRSWGLVKDIDGNIIGVFSQGREEPLIAGPLVIALLTLPAAHHYSDWKFVPVLPS